MTKKRNSSPEPGGADSPDTAAATKLQKPRTAAGHAFEERDPNAPERCPLVVGIGASAGGQEAMEQLFTAMPADCGISYVVVIHLPPDGPSYLPEILGRYTTMEVVTAEEGMELAPNRVQVVPAGRDLTVSGRRLRLEEPGERCGLPHPIDRLFSSLAVELNEHLIAVVLSGFGMDGAAGVKAVREAGGIVIVQEPGSALTPAMPRSAIATGAADFILPAEEIPVKIAEIARGTCHLPSRACRTATPDEEIHTIFALVKNHTGHDFSSYKTNTVMRRIERRMTVNDVSGIGKYIALLRENPQEAQALCQDILIGVTSFFRDPDAFAILRREIIPQLFSGRDPDVPVRIWHACCATGEEVYSMAILIREYLNAERLGAKVQLFATDIDQVAVAQARAGLYGDDIEADVGENRLKTFFTRTEGRWQVAKQLREMIVFAHHSLIKDPPFSKLDLLVCRNFLIYLNPDMQKRLITLFHQVLKPGGFLFLGAAETVGNNAALFTPFDKKWKIFERPESGRPAEMLFPFTAPIRKPPVPGRPKRPAAAEEPGPGAAAEKLLMERYSPPCVVVNEKYEVVHVSTRANRFLEVPVGEPTRDIMRMAREELRPALRAAIYKAFAEDTQVAFRGVKTDTGDGVGTVNVLVEPIAVSPSAGKLAMLVFEPAPPPALLAPVDGEEALDGDETSKDILIRQLEEQLRITHEQLQATSEQLESTHEGFMSANEELMSINEEFQSGNEELQSTNEELETSKEELQALNEELVTVNAELQGKVEELDRSNSDMENLLASSEIATIFLDRQLTIKRFSPAMAGIFNLIPADIGRPFRHLAGTIDWSGLPRDAETVLEQLTPIEREVSAVEGGRHYLMRVLPYRAAERKIDGIVVTLIDITEHKRMEEETVHLASFPQLNPNPVLEVDSAGTVIFSNPATQKVLETLGVDAAGMNVFLPADLDTILRDWDRKTEAILYREINLRERVYGESIFLTPQFDVARIYAFDTTEQKQAQEALLESEEQVRRKLESIISPEGDIGDLDLGDIIDARSLQSLVDDFYELTGMPMGLLDLKGKVLVGVGWQDACTQFHRINPESCRNCVESDVQLSAGVPHGEYKIYKCKNNMWDVATPVMVGDRQFGNLFMGQFFFEDEPLDYELFRSQARQYGFDEKEYIAALEAVPRLSRETLNTSMAFFMKLADILSKLSYSNLNLARSLTERDTLMEAMRESKEQFRTLAESIPNLAWWANGDGYITWYNRRWYEYTGTTPEQMEGWGWQSVHDPKVLPQVLERWQASIATGQPFDMEFPLRGADGVFRSFLTRVLPMKDSAGQVLRWFGTNTDISALKRAEEALRLSEERYHSLFESMMEGFAYCKMLYDGQGSPVDFVYIDVNDAFGRLTGLENVKGKMVTEVIPGIRESSQDLFEIYSRVALTGHPEKFEIEFKPLSTWFSISVYSMEKEYFVAVFDDITQRKRAEEALRTAHDELELRVAERTEELASAINVLQEEISEREIAEEKILRLNRLHAVLSETDQAIVRAADRDTLFHDFCRIAVEEGGFKLSWIGLVDGKTGQVKMAASHGATGYLDDIRISAKEEPAGLGPTGIAVREGTFYICNDFLSDPCTSPWHDRGRAHGIRASASIALKLHGETIGALTLYADKKDFFDRSHVELLLRMGAELSFALDNLDREALRREAEQALRAETSKRLQAVEELRINEQLLMQQSRQAAMGEMIGNIAHQWRQPLNTLGLIIQELPMNYELGAFTKENLDASVAKARQVIGHMSQTIDDFRNFFRPDKEKVLFKANDVVTKTVSLIDGSFQEQNITVEVRTPEDIFIYGHPNEYSQVILNILINARDAFIERRANEPKTVIITLSRENDRVVMTITDNAGGIGEEIMEKIFDPYFTTKGPDKGTGVGLFMSKTIIEKNMSGSLRARNTGSGAEFRIEV